jgi:hypothetical protein
VPLRVITRAALPLTELSALAVRRVRRGSELVCAGDHEHALLTVPLGAGGSPGRPRRRELAGLLGNAGSSGFEGVACDGAGRVLLLQEGPSRVLVLSAGLARVEAVVELAVAPGQPGFGREWADDDNARGEGLLLMDRGHLLVAKQKDPVCLIEFGRRGTPRSGCDRRRSWRPATGSPCLAARAAGRWRTASWAGGSWRAGTRTASRAPTTWRWTPRGGSCS